MMSHENSSPLAKRLTKEEVDQQGRSQLVQVGPLGVFIEVLS